MGCYTIIEHEGKELQIYTGGDDLQRYRIGQRLDHQVDDGCYEACAEPGQDNIVYIRNNKVESVLPSSLTHQMGSTTVTIRMTEKMWEDALGVEQPPPPPKEPKERIHDHKQGVIRDINTLVFMLEKQHLQPYAFHVAMQAHHSSFLGNLISTELWARLSEPSFAMKLFSDYKEPPKPPDTTNDDLLVAIAKLKSIL